MARKGKPITLEEHLERIRPLGGKASMAKRSAKERTDFATAGGLAGGKARAEKLSPAKRKSIAKKAAAARWGTKTPKTSL